MRFHLNCWDLTEVDGLSIMAIQTLELYRSFCILLVHEAGIAILGSREGVGNMGNDGYFCQCAHTLRKSHSHLNEGTMKDFSSGVS